MLHEFRRHLGVAGLRRVNEVLLAPLLGGGGSVPPQSAFGMVLGTAGRWRVSVARALRTLPPSNHPLAEMLPEQLTMDWNQPDETA